MNCRVRITARPNKKRFVRWKDKAVWQKNRGLHRALQAVVLCVTDNSDHLQAIIRCLYEHERRLVKLEHRAPYALPERVEDCKILLYEGLIDNGRMSRTHDLRLVKENSRQKRKVQ